jgi:hypothetical protein
MACAQAVQLRAPVVFTPYNFAPSCDPPNGGCDTDDARAAPLVPQKRATEWLRKNAVSPAATIFFLLQSSACGEEYRRRSGSTSKGSVFQSIVVVLPILFRACPRAPGPAARGRAGASPLPGRG